MANPLNNVPDPENAADNPKGFLSGSFFFMVKVGLAWGLYQMGKSIIGTRVVSVGNAASNALSSASESTEEIANVEVN